VTQNRKRSTSSTSLKLVPHVMEDWQRALLELARIKGLERDQTPHDKIKAILKQELKNIRQLWEAFTVERSQLPRYLLDPKKQSVAYLSGFHLPNLARFQGMLERLNMRFSWPKLLSHPDQIRVMDWGCGTGALSHGLSLFLKKYKVPDHQLSWSIIDQHGAFLDTTKMLLLYQRPKLKIRSSKGQLESLISRVMPKTEDEAPNEKTLQILLIGYVWNELKTNPRARKKMEEAFIHLADQPCLIFLVEPGNQHPARQAMEVRNFLVENNWQALYPCPTKAIGCPMLENNRDWCYSEFTWQRPPLVKNLDDRLEINHEKLSTSCYAFASPSAMAWIKNADWAQPAAVVVGRPTQRVIKGAPQPQTFGPKFDYLSCEGTSLNKTKPLKGAELILRGQSIIPETETVKKDQPALKRPVTAKKTTKKSEPAKEQSLAPKRKVQTKKKRFGRQ